VFYLLLGIQKGEYYSIDEILEETINQGCKPTEEWMFVEKVKERYDYGNIEDYYGIDIRGKSISICHDFKKEPMNTTDWWESLSVVKRDLILTLQK
ncbi:hypothetical protein LCGC14_2955820, partial [marine sediment metagenome]